MNTTKTKSRYTKLSRGRIRDTKAVEVLRRINGLVEDYKALVSEDKSSVRYNKGVRIQGMLRDLIVEEIDGWVDLNVHAFSAHSNRPWECRLCGKGKDAHVGQDSHNRSR